MFTNSYRLPPQFPPFRTLSQLFAKMLQVTTDTQVTARSMDQIIDIFKYLL